MAYLNPTTSGIGIFNEETGLIQRLPLVTKESLDKSMTATSNVRYMSASILNSSPAFINNEKHTLSVTSDVGIYIKDEDNLIVGTNIEQLIIPFFPVSTLQPNFEYTITPRARANDLRPLTGVYYFFEENSTRLAYKYDEAVAQSLVFSHDSGNPVQMSAKYICTYDQKSFPEYADGSVNLSQPLRYPKDHNLLMTTRIYFLDLERYALDVNTEEIQINTVLSWKLSIDNNIKNGSVLNAQGNFTAVRGGTDIKIDFEFLVDEELYTKIVTPYVGTSAVNDTEFNVTVVSGNIPQSAPFFETDLIFELQNVKASKLLGMETDKKGFYKITATFINPEVIKIYSYSGANVVTYGGVPLVKDGKFVTHSGY